MPSVSPMTVQTPRAAHHGYGWLIASVFILGETAGSGLVAVPSAVVHTGFVGGSLLLILLCVTLAYTACLLGKNWLCMIRRWPELAEQHCRKPYPEMARRAMGNTAGLFASGAIYLTLFGGVVVFSLLAARNISSLLALFGLQIHFCIILPVLALLLWPFMMLRSPMNFWQVSICASVSTSLAVALILVGVSKDFGECHTHSSFPTVSIESFSLGFGTIVFSYGGHPVLPTIQHDMRRQQDFPKAVVLSYIAMFLLYAPASIFSYWTYGGSLTDSIVTSIQTEFLRHIVNTLITLHVLFSLLIIANPLYQAAEQMAGTKHEFGMGRFLVRSVVFFAGVFTAASVPNFGVLLDLVGGSTMTFLALVLPGICALFLEAGERKQMEHTSDDKQGTTLQDVYKFSSGKRLILELAIIAVGIIIGVTTTTNATIALFHSSLATPCYLQYFRGFTVPVGVSSLRCCGAFANISSTGQYDVCSTI